MAPVIPSHQFPSCLFLFGNGVTELYKIFNFLVYIQYLLLEVQTKRQFLQKCFYSLYIPDIEILYKLSVPNRNESD